VRKRETLKFRTVRCGVRPGPHRDWCVPPPDVVHLATRVGPSSPPPPPPPPPPPNKGGGTKKPRARRHRSLYLGRRPLIPCADWGAFHMAGHYAWGAPQHGVGSHSPSFVRPWRTRFDSCAPRLVAPPPKGTTTVGNGD
jgi:hypothetical protein